MKRRKKPNRIRAFYYAHPYLVIFNVLMIYNILIILLFSLLLAYLKDGFVNSKNYLEAIQYCAIYTMNSGDIWSEAPTSVIILKIIINTTQMITFSGALIGLATSMLQNLFNRRVHNVGKIKLKNHYVILNWSPIGANIIKELSYMPGKKAIVILSDIDKDIITEEIDNLFLESNIEKKDIRIFVKKSDPSSRKALKEISIDKCISIALLSKASWLNSKVLSDADSFKILMSILSINKNANVIVEVNNDAVSREIGDLMKASADLNKANVSIFSRNTIVGHALGRAAINTSFADLYYYLLSYEGGSFYSIDDNMTVEEALSKYNKAIPIAKYKEKDGEKLYLYSRYDYIFKCLTKKEALKDINYEKNLLKNNFTLFVIGDNERSHSILDVCDTHNRIKDGKIKCNIYPINVDIDDLINDINNAKGRCKVLILSDENSSLEQQDNNVFMTLIKLKTNEKFDKNTELYAEIFDPSSRFSLESLNVSGMIISNEMVALYIAQLLTHPTSHKFYEDLLLNNYDTNDIYLDFDVRKAKELIKFDEELTFNSKLEFISSLYKSSNYEYLPIGFVGKDLKKNMIFESISNVIEGVVDVKDKILNSVTSALTLSDSATDSPIDKTNILIFDYNIRKQEKLTINKDTIIILVHYNKN